MASKDRGKNPDKAADKSTTKDSRDSVTRKEAGSPQNAGKSTTRRGEDVAKQEKEAGRFGAGTEGKTQRPVGKSTARDSTGVNPKDPIDPNSPTLQRGGG